MWSYAEFIPFHGTFTMESVYLCKQHAPVRIFPFHSTCSLWRVLIVSLWLCSVWVVASTLQLPHVDKSQQSSPNVRPSWGTAEDASEEPQSSMKLLNPCYRHHNGVLKEKNSLKEIFSGADISCATETYVSKNEDSLVRHPQPIMKETEGVTSIKGEPPSSHSSSFLKNFKPSPPIGNRVPLIFEGDLSNREPFQVEGWGLGQHIERMDTHFHRGNLPSYGTILQKDTLENRHETIPREESTKPKRKAIISDKKIKKCFEFCNSVKAECLDMSEWELLCVAVECTLWRRRIGETQKYEYMARGKFDDISVSAYNKTINDLEFRQSWDENIDIVRIIESYTVGDDKDGEDNVYSSGHPNPTETSYKSTKNSETSFCKVTRAFSGSKLKEVNTSSTYKRPPSASPEWDSSRLSEDYPILPSSVALWNPFFPIFVEKTCTLPPPQERPPLFSLSLMNLLFSNSDDCRVHFYTQESFERRKLRKGVSGASTLSLESSERSSWISSLPPSHTSLEQADPLPASTLSFFPLEEAPPHPETPCGVVNTRQMVLRERTPAAAFHISSEAQPTSPAASETIQNPDQRETQPESLEEIVYWRFRLPWPVKGRDFVYSRRIKAMEGAIISVQEAVYHPECPEIPSSVRILDYHSTLVLYPTNPEKNIDQPGVEYILYHCDDPRITLPNWITTYVSAQTIPSTMKALHQAAKKFSEGSPSFVPPAGKLQTEASISSTSSFFSGTKENGPLAMPSVQRSPPTLSSKGKTALTSSKPSSLLGKASTDSLKIKVPPNTRVDASYFLICNSKSASFKAFPIHEVPSFAFLFPSAWKKKSRSSQSRCSSLCNSLPLFQRHSISNYDVLSSLSTSSHVNIKPLLAGISLLGDSNPLQWKAYTGKKLRELPSYYSHRRGSVLTSPIPRLTNVKFLLMDTAERSTLHSEAIQVHFLVKCFLHTHFIRETHPSLTGNSSPSTQGNYYVPDWFARFMSLCILHNENPLNSHSLACRLECLNHHEERKAEESQSLLNHAVGHKTIDETNTETILRRARRSKRSMFSRGMDPMQHGVFEYSPNVHHLYT
ncbi:hypothetical protein IE077_001184 [Cardiosporidium cionae]|uniref:START domain-containing protein n=1 Tax=Cardiosporidium cionae TaxID=476202 RepID=A0ABQ7J5R0_9APIC|nr:hypothetical protein IE077_001184 [Cardiosporidium cionae]|eukprot:KAF8819328.1 hypothetical protein IE077_001184 [Cardiosporidium cionae]